MKFLSKSVLMTTGLMAVVCLTIGCGQSATSPVPKPQAQTQAGAAVHKDGAENSDDSNATAKHDHSGWWCKEHGVPEGECGRCSSKLAAAFQKDGDWCKDHDRPDSQCFICHPEREATFAAKYEAKYGKKPPKPEIN